MLTRRDVLISVFVMGIAAPASAQSLLDKAGALFGGKASKIPGVSGGTGSGAGTLSNTDIIAGLKEALSVATGRTVDTVGKADGYLGDPKIKIPLPGSLQTVKQALDVAGYGSLTNDLETRLNRAAEAAAPEAKDVFIESIRQMSVDDAKGILNGPQDAATQYFRRTMSDPLKSRMRPIVDGQLSQVGAYKSLERVVSQAGALAGLTKPGAGLTDYTLDKALEGMFYYVAKEEAAIRANPAARTTDLLRTVFK